MVQSIRRHGGFPRIHCHGRIRNLLLHFAAMGATATDPIEPPPQGGVELRYVRQKYGRTITPTTMANYETMVRLVERA